MGNKKPVLKYDYCLLLSVRKKKKKTLKKQYSYCFLCGQIGIVVCFGNIPEPYKIETTKTIGNNTVFHIFILAYTTKKNKKKQGFQQPRVGCWRRSRLCLQMFASLWTPQPTPQPAIQYSYWHIGNTMQIRNMLSSFCKNKHSGNSCEQ